MRAGFLKNGKVYDGVYMMDCFFKDEALIMGICYFFEKDYD